MSAQPIAWRAIEDAIHAWIESSTGIAHTWEDQTAPQPPYPFAHSNILPGSAARPVRAEHQIKADGSIRVFQNVDFTVSTGIDVGPPDANNPDCHSRTLISAMLAHLDAPGQREAFGAVGLAVRERQPAIDLDLQVGSEWISRTSVDIRFGVASVLEDIAATRPGYFDKVELSSQIDGTQTPDSHDLTNEIFDPNA